MMTLLRVDTGNLHENCHLIEIRLTQLTHQIELRYFVPLPRFTIREAALALS